MISLFIIKVSFRQTHVPPTHIHTHTHTLTCAEKIYPSSITVCQSPYTVYAWLIVAYLTPDYALIFILCLMHAIYAECKLSEFASGFVSGNKLSMSMGENMGILPDIS